MECLLEEMRIKLSIAVSDLLGASGLRILRALAQGETDAKKLALWGDERLKCSDDQPVGALTGKTAGDAPACATTGAVAADGWTNRKANALIARVMKPHQDAVIRLAEVPGRGEIGGAGRNRTDA